MGAYENYKLIKNESSKELQDKVKGAVDSGFKRIADKKAADKAAKEKLPVVIVNPPAIEKDKKIEEKKEDISVVPATEVSPKNEEGVDQIKKDNASKETWIR
tara:strand:+ start:288 stop:593 length:306 start_codon:yes stop_codon:yes gene_type:complete